MVLRKPDVYFRRLKPDPSHPYKKSIQNGSVTQVTPKILKLLKHIQETLDPQAQNLPVMVDTLC